MKKLLIIIGLLTLFTEVYSQSLPRLPITWSKRFTSSNAFDYLDSYSDTISSEYSRYITVLPDSNFIYINNEYKHRGFAILNDTGALVSKSERLRGGAVNSLTAILSVQPAPINGGYIAAGGGTFTDSSFAGAGFHTGSGGDAMLIKYNDTLGIEWLKYYGGTGLTGFYSDAFSKAIETADGGYIAIGVTASQNGDLTGIKTYTTAPVYWIVKLDSIGNIQWQKTYGGDRKLPNNFLYTYNANSIIENAADSTYMIIGTTASQNGDVWGAHGHNDIWVLKLNSIGDTLWTRAYGGSGNDQAFSLFKTGDGNYIITGSTGSTDGDISVLGSGAWRFKINSSDGSIIWQRREGDVIAAASYYAGTTYQEHQPTLLELQDGTLVWAYYGNDTTAILNNNVQICHIDGSTGNTLRIGSYGSSNEDIPVRLRLNKDNSILVAAVFGFTNNNNDYDLTGSTDTTGLDWWFTLAPCPALIDAPDVTICVGGSYTFGSQIITAAGTYYDTLSTYYSCDSIVKLVVLVDSIDVPTITASGNTLSTGTYSSYQWLDGSGSPISGATAQTYDATASGNYYVVVTGANGCIDTSAVYNHTATGINEPALFSNMRLYPNPANDVVYITIPQLKGGATVTVSNIEGRVIQTGQLSSSIHQLPVGELTGGIYIIKITTDEGTAVRKIVKK